MNSDNRLTFLLLVAGGIFAAGFGLFVIGHRFYDGIVSRDDQLAKLRDEEGTLQLKMGRLQKEQKQVEKWRSISLPGNLAVTSNTYAGFLFELMQKHKLSVLAYPTAGNTRIAATKNATGPIVAPLSFATQFEGTFAQLAAFLEEFYRLNLPQEIREFTVMPQGKGSEAKLEVHLKIDVLTMSNVPDRQFVIAPPERSLAQLETIASLMRFPATGMALAIHNGVSLYGRSKLANEVHPQRVYATMQRKNIFAGLTTTGFSGPPTAANRAILKSVNLYGITANSITEEAKMFNRWTGRDIRLRAEGGFNSFEIRDENDQVVLKGKVLAIKSREVVFESEGKAYLLHIGQFISDAKEMTPEELKSHDVELTAAGQN
jgi:hypothetical protein